MQELSGLSKNEIAWLYGPWTAVVVGCTNLATHLPATPPVNVHTHNVSGVGCRFYRVQVE